MATKSESEWEAEDLVYATLFLALGIPMTIMLVRLLQDLDEPVAWVILGIGNVGWLMGPLLVFLGANAFLQALISTLCGPRSYPAKTQRLCKGRSEPS